MHSINDIVKDIRNGKMVIIMDDEDRENEGDLLIAASKVGAEDINFMAHFGRGLICLTLTQEPCKQLDLPLMVNQGTDKLSLFKSQWCNEKNKKPVQTSPLSS
jgi:3,4-dihydroxy 2-butanone 4-phosphate synthase/GTP cyclohydrolase II